MPDDDKKKRADELKKAQNLRRMGKYHDRILAPNALDDSRAFTRTTRPDLIIKKA